ncbi:MAG: proprotein convertase P-domain-containing protein [Deltaproteobacteria bacterium]|nr:proprotein convertase P-domain-containing protein [Deltaproteobacteria bacterium]
MVGNELRQCVVQCGAALLFLLAPAILLALNANSAAVQGVLTAPSGAAVDGTYDLTFSVYEKEQGGTAIWSEVASAVKVQAGVFQWQLGSTKALWSDTEGSQALWIGVQVGSDPELPRVAIGQVIYARYARGLACQGCVSNDHFANGSITAAKLAFNYAGAATKGGAAKDVDCTGCVGVAEMKFDGDLDLGGSSLKGKNATFSGDLAAKTVTASAFIGDGSKLTGVGIQSGSCKAGEVMTGVASDGSLQCTALATGGSGGLSPTSCKAGEAVVAVGADGKVVCGVIEAKLPADGLAAVSNGLLTNVFDYEVAASKEVQIIDGSLNGTTSQLGGPNDGVVKSVAVKVSLTNSNIGNVSVELTPPDGKTILLKDKSGTGTSWTGEYPAPDTPASGSLDTMVGQSPKGPWKLRVWDEGAENKDFDGAFVWSLKLQLLSDSTVFVNGNLHVNGERAALKVCYFNSDECKGWFVGSTQTESGVGPNWQTKYHYELFNSDPEHQVNFGSVNVWTGSDCTGSGATSSLANIHGTSWYEGEDCAGAEYRYSSDMGKASFDTRRSLKCFIPGQPKDGCKSYRNKSGCVNQPDTKACGQGGGNSFILKSNRYRAFELRL